MLRQAGRTCLEVKAFSFTINNSLERITLVLILLILGSCKPINTEKQNTTLENSSAKAYFAGGCFWGVEYFFEKQNGVRQVTSGYMGGKLKNPTYQDVSYTHSGHVEAVEVQYDPDKVSYEALARLFFEIHDPTQIDGQGPDIGYQYSSMIFYNNVSEKEIAQKLIDLLKNKGLDVVTDLKEAKIFYPAEEYHQDYYAKNSGKPYCHFYKKRFQD